MRRDEAGTRTLAAVAALALAALACGSESGEPPLVIKATAPVTVPAAHGPRDVAVVQVRNFGDIRIELLSDVAPKTVSNFIELANKDFYEGTTFHRVIPGFAIQGGDPLSLNRDPRDDGHGNPGYTIEDEFSALSHVRGIVSMANRGRPNTAGSQFFIVVQAARPLDSKYTVFGHVTGGIEVVDAISAVERDQFGRRGPIDRPFEDVVIESVHIEPAGSSPGDAPAMAGGTEGDGKGQTLPATEPTAWRSGPADQPAVGLGPGPGPDLDPRLGSTPAPAPIASGPPLGPLRVWPMEE